MALISKILSLISSKRVIWGNLSYFS
jgi:hypothetical protein